MHGITLTPGLGTGLTNSILGGAPALWQNMGDAVNSFTTNDSGFPITVSMDGNGIEAFQNPFSLPDVLLPNLELQNQITGTESIEVSADPHEDTAIANNSIQLSPMDAAVVSISLFGVGLVAGSIFTLIAASKGSSNRIKFMRIDKAISNLCKIDSTEKRNEQMIKLLQQIESDEQALNYFWQKAYEHKKLLNPDLFKKIHLERFMTSESIADLYYGLERRDFSNLPNMSASDFLRYQHTFFEDPINLPRKWKIVALLIGSTSSEKVERKEMAREVVKVALTFNLPVFELMFEEKLPDNWIDQSTYQIILKKACHISRSGQGDSHRTAQRVLKKIWFNKADKLSSEEDAGKGCLSPLSISSTLEACLENVALADCMFGEKECLSEALLKLFSVGWLSFTEKDVNNLMTLTSKTRNGKAIKETILLLNSVFETKPDIFSKKSIQLFANLYYDKSYRGYFIQNYTQGAVLAATLYRAGKMPPV
jgi:hypothetical protein